jgi:hypothetical protein
MVTRTEKTNTGFGNVFVGCPTAKGSAETPHRHMLHEIIFNSALFPDTQKLFTHPLYLNYIGKKEEVNLVSSLWKEP